MQVPKLGKAKDLDLACYIQKMFIERMYYFRKDVIDQSPSLKTNGIIGKLDKLDANALKVIEILEEMKAELEHGHT